MTVKLTETALRRIVREEAGKFRRGRRLNESQTAATKVLHNAMEEYIDQMVMAGIDPEDACDMMKDEVHGWCTSDVLAGMYDR